MAGSISLIFGHTTEVFLECEADLLVITTCSYDSCYRFCYCVSSSVIWTPGREIWIKAVTHHGNCISFSVLYRNFCNHALCFCKLILTTVWHKYAAPAPIEPSNISTRPFWEHTLRSASVSSHFALTSTTSGLSSKKASVFFVRDLNLYSCFLMCTVGIKECTGNINDLFASPCKNKAWLFGNDCNRDCRDFLRLQSQGICQHLLDLQQLPYAPGIQIMISVPSRPAYFSELCQGLREVHLQAHRWQRIHRLHQSRYIF